MTIHRAPLLILALTILPCLGTALAQSGGRFHRLYLSDKGTPRRYILPGDSLYRIATAHLTERSLSRRAKVLPLERLVSTDDLPIPSNYLVVIAETGAEIRQKSRWMNTVMVLADSVVLERLQRLSFIDSVVTPRPARRLRKDRLEKPALVYDDTATAQALGAYCITDRYGLAGTQNRSINIDDAHKLGFAGEGVLVGVLDAGFAWRNHDALRHTTIEGEWDVVYNDSLTADEPGETAAQGHGTAVLSMIAGSADGRLVGGAPHATFLIARTEDVRSELHLEEDNFVAGLEWMESQGVDVTNTSLGYTTFDNPEQPYNPLTLDGESAHASRGVNHATALGVICLVAAGNDAAHPFHYIGVPAEADSAIAVAATDSLGNVASFSSRGVLAWERLKPNIAAMGVGNQGADHAGQGRYVKGQGTSYAAPMATSAVAILLSARRSLRPWELREALYATASHATDPDTAVGHGMIDVRRALRYLAATAPIVGTPRARRSQDHVFVSAWTMYHPDTILPAGSDDNLGTLTLRVTYGDQSRAESTVLQPRDALVSWELPARPISPSDSSEIISYEIRSSMVPQIVRLGRVRLQERYAATATPAWDRFVSTLCLEASIPSPGIATSVTNPAIGNASIGFQIPGPMSVSLVIYNSHGEEALWLLRNVPYAEGYYLLDVPTAQLPSGAYYYRLHAASLVADSSVADSSVADGTMIILH